MSVVYGQLAAKQAAARIMAASGKRKHEYDSDEDTEGGKTVLKVIFVYKNKLSKISFVFFNIWKALQTFKIHGKLFLGFLGRW